ncbi:MAG TPA: 50S ribosomal protein L30e [Methanomicrobiales archaeon]|jgi:large subunit ribosomal protein L30e|nr:50S ribosomal protein L30e [Methanomicrobiales archaeon]
MDFNLSLRRALKTGKVFLGQNSTRTCIDEGKAKLVVVAQNCPPEFRKFLETVKGVPVHVYAGSGVQLGMACGKPFLVSALAVTEPGESDILSLARS